MSEEAGHLEGRTAPAFSRQSSRGYLELKTLLGRKPLVLLFMPDLSDPGCSAYVNAFGRDLPHYRALGSEIIVLTAGASVGPRGMPFVVVPKAKEVFATYGVLGGDELPLAGVVVVDRYGEVASAHAGETCSDLPEEPRVARLLLGAESVCPECGVAEDHWLGIAD